MDIWTSLPKEISDYVATTLGSPQHADMTRIGKWLTAVGLGSRLPWQVFAAAGLSNAYVNCGSKSYASTDKSAEADACRREQAVVWCAKSYLKAATSCVPTTCEMLNAECGIAPDGCGGTIDCGTCPAGRKCGMDNKCGGPAKASPPKATPPSYVGPAFFEIHESGEPNGEQGPPPSESSRAWPWVLGLGLLGAVGIAVAVHYNKTTK